MQTGAIILCGGFSSRMGRDKATLPFGPELMLHRMIRLLSEVVELRNIVVVAAPEQQLPPLRSEVKVTHDRRQGRGPLEGLSAGLNQIGSHIDAAYVTSCDAPLLIPAFVKRIFELLDNHDIVVPSESGRLHPLAAAYRPSVLKTVQQLLEADRLRLKSLFEEAETRIVDVEELRAVDPQLHSLVNLNHPADYQAALKAAGFSDEPIGP